MTGGSAMVTMVTVSFRVYWTDQTRWLLYE